MTVEVARERARTPGVDDAHHLNAAGAALPSARTLSATLEHLHLEARMGGYEASNAARGRLDGVYDLAARLIGAHPDEIALTESATVGWQRTVDALRLGEGDRVLVSRSGYVSCALQLLALERERGVVVELLPNGPDGAVDLEALRAALDAGPAALLALTHIPTSSGLVEPVAEAGRLARAAGVTYLLDATQSVGHLPVDVAEIGCDALVTTGRKYLRAPRGTAFLYVRRSLLERLEPLAPDVRGATWTADREWTLDAGARRFETWETSHALRLGLGVALAESDALGIETIAAHLVERGAALRDALASVPGVAVVDPPARSDCALVTFVVDGAEPRAVAAALAARAVNVVAVPAGHGRWDLEGRDLDAVVRASAHVYTSDADLDALTDAVVDLARPVQARPPGPPAERADAVVVGLGVQGSAVARALAERGLSVIGLERLRLGHGRGGSHGPGREIRRAALDAGLAEAVYGAWARLEDAAGEPLLIATGGVFARPRGAAGAQDDEVLDAAAVRRLFPAIELGDGLEALHDPEAGVLLADRAVAALQRLARAAGARLREAEPLLRWEPDGDGVAVETVMGRIAAGRLVVCAGAWTAELLPGLGGEEVAPVAEVRLRPLDPVAVAVPALGAFEFALPGGVVRGVGALDGAGVTLWCDGASPDAVTRMTRLAERHLPAAAGAVAAASTSLRAVGPSALDARALPGAPQVLAAGGADFMFGPAAGEAIAAAV
jgi:selenocysteine lyase/cysteine desulfurase/glycine/D-amino acid oxidase-like deaminating enzyme